MKLSDAFPSNFLKAEDLNGKAVALTISDVSLEEIQGDRKREKKLLLSFHKTDKKLICNKTNANTIAKLYGDDTDGWLDQRITIMPREVEYQGDMVWAIRVSLQKPAAPGTRPSPVREPEPEHLPEPPGDLLIPGDDSEQVPF